MRFYVKSSLQYQVSGPSTLLCSLRCLKTPGQSISEECLEVIGRADRTDLSVGLEENRFTKLESSWAGELRIDYNAIAETTVSYPSVSDIFTAEVASFGPEVITYLFPSRYVPSDSMRALAWDLFGGINGAFQQAMAIENWLFEHIAYLPGSSDEQSGALDTFLTRSGVCRDFAHLGIAFCRALTIPARYVTVYAYLLEPQDFHAAFEVFIDGRWYLIDGTRIAPLNGMVRIAFGRDACDASVATLFGGIVGTGMSVHCQISFDADEEFLPMNRCDLEDKGEAILME
ncbi:MAG: transglutaminase family protein [Verrucomicrobiales bacterium]|nr:transglutaminase family protein [Verrucomicrobiales bacterium]